MDPKLLIDPSHEISSFDKDPVVSGDSFDCSTDNAGESQPEIEEWIFYIEHRTHTSNNTKSAIALKNTNARVKLFSFHQPEILPCPTNTRFAVL